MHVPEQAMLALCRRAGAIMRAADRGEAAKHVEAKGGYANFVTAYDKKIQNFLEQELRVLLPTASFLAEENGESANPVGEGLTFVIDPIDGTTNFIHDYGCSTVSVGLLLDGEPLWGAVYQPYTDELFHAMRGGGAFLNGAAIHVSARPLHEALVCVGTSPYYREQYGHRTAALTEAVLMRAADLRRSGTAALDLCHVACGRADGFFEWKLSPWDYAAGALIVREAGGVACTMDGGRLPMDTGSSVAAGNPATLAALLELVRQIEAAGERAGGKTGEGAGGEESVL